ncbi:MAG: SPP1 phage holin family protein [Clostridiales Family XIII bacterium]|jgi:hypothetical protein|nr:SPP1 phage holin family protein [Clostridiales Family XIII bacterium]
MNRQAITQIVILAVTIIAAIGGLFGADMSALDPDQIGVVAGGLITVIAPIWLAWKDTPLTNPAQKAQALIKAYKQGVANLTDEEVAELMAAYKFIGDHFVDNSDTPAGFDKFSHEAEFPEAGCGHAVADDLDDDEEEDGDDGL